MPQLPENHNKDVPMMDATSNSPSSSPLDDARVFCEDIMDWNDAGVELLLQGGGQQQAALACLERGLAGFGINLQNILLQDYQRNFGGGSPQQTTPTPTPTPTTSQQQPQQQQGLKQPLQSTATPFPVLPTATTASSPSFSFTNSSTISSTNPTGTTPTRATTTPTNAAFPCGPLLKSIKLSSVVVVAARTSSQQQQQQQQQQEPQRSTNVSTGSTQQDTKGPNHRSTSQQPEQDEQQAPPPPPLLQDIEDVFFDIYDRALVFTSRPKDWQGHEHEAQYLSACLTHAAAVLLYNAGLCLHQMAQQRMPGGSTTTTTNGTTTTNSRSLDFCLAHETYRMALYLLEENVLMGCFCPVPFNLLLLALFNNLANLNGQAFFDVARTALCQEKLLAVFLQTTFDATQQQDDYAFFYMQLLLSYTRTPLLAPAA